MSTNDNKSTTSKAVLKKAHIHKGEQYPKGTELSKLGKICDDDLKRMKDREII